jgi:hypothetical protein
MELEQLLPKGETPGNVEPLRSNHIVLMLVNLPQRGGCLQQQRVPMNQKQARMGYAHTRRAHAIAQPHRAVLPTGHNLKVVKPPVWELLPAGLERCAGFHMHKAKAGSNGVQVGILGCHYLSTRVPALACAAAAHF